MAYDSLKALIRQYIKTNGEQEITGQILQNVLVEMVNQYPSTDGFATQSWVTSQLAGYATQSWVWESLADDTNEQIASSHLTTALSTYATITQLGNYLPLTGGTLTGGLNISDGSHGYAQLFVDEDGLNIMTGSLTGTQQLYTGRIYSDSTIEATGSITGFSFIKAGGTSAQFLKADGSVDSNTYITASELTGYATQSWVWESLADDTNEQIASSHLTTALSTYATITQLGNYLPLTGGTITGNLNISNTGNGYAQMFVDEDGFNIMVGALTNQQIYTGKIYSESTITSIGFIKNGGTSAQFLKADGSVDSNTYITASSLTGYATQSWVTSQLAGYLPLTGGTLTGGLNISDGSHGYAQLFVDEDGLNIMTGSLTGTQQLYTGRIYSDSTIEATGSITGFSFIKSGGTSAQFLKADGSVDSTAYLPKQGNSFYFITDADMPETAANISTLNAAHRMTLYRNAILMPYQMDNANDGGFIRSRGTSESSAIFEIGMWDDSGAGETIQFNYYPTTSTINPTYSVTVPKKSGTIALTSDLASYNPTANFKTINNQSIIGTGNINIEGGGGGAYYDAEIEYLESTGTQWIDTGYIPTGDDIRILTKIMYNGYSTNGQWIGWFATYVDEQTNTYRIIRNQSSDSSVLLYNDTMAGGGGTQFNVSIGSIYEIDFNRNTYNINGITGTFSNSRGSENTAPLNIFGGDGFKGRIYSFSVFKNDVLVLDFIPVRVGQVGYLYDKVSGQLFGNAGTGSFVLGQDTGPGGGLPYLPLTGGTITGNLTINGNNGINFGGDDYIRIRRDSSRLLILNETTNNTIIGNWSNENYVFIANDLLGGTTNSTYSTFSPEWSILDDGSAQFNSVSQTSDLRKKTIMGDVPMNLYNVANAPLFKFTWKDEKKYSGQHIGSAAQYWQTVLPELVIQGSDADMTLAMQYDVIALASAITVAKTVVNHEERIILLERENEALKKEIADLKSA